MSTFLLLIIICITISVPLIVFIIVELYINTLGSYIYLYNSDYIFNKSLKLWHFLPIMMGGVLFITYYWTQLQKFSLSTNQSFYSIKILPITVFVFFIILVVLPRFLWNKNKKKGQLSYEYKKHTKNYPKIVHVIMVLFIVLSSLSWFYIVFNQYDWFINSTEILLIVIISFLNWFLYYYSQYLLSLLFTPTYKIINHSIEYRCCFLGLSVKKQLIDMSKIKKILLLFYGYGSSPLKSRTVVCSEIILYLKNEKSISLGFMQRPFNYTDSIKTKRLDSINKKDWLHPKIVEDLHHIVSKTHIDYEMKRVKKNIIPGANF